MLVVGHTRAGIGLILNQCPFFYSSPNKHYLRLGAQKLTGLNLKVVWAEFSTLI
jgi:hypothetical protein